MHEQGIDMPLPRMYFLHIPKTAGTSLRYWLFDLYGESNWFPAHVLPDFDKFSREQINAYQLYSGHFGYALLDCLDQPPHVVTWLRDPLQRVVSNYYYLLDSYDHLVNLALQYGRHDWVENYAIARDTPLAKLCQSRKYRAGSNLQTRFLSGNCPNRSKGPPPCDDAMLETAKRNLEQMFCFGLCEAMDASLRLLCEKLAVPYRPLTRRMNMGNAPSADRAAMLTPEEQAIIREANLYDEQLYAFARELFERRVREFLARKGVKAPDGTDLLAAYGREPLQSEIRRAVDGDSRHVA